MTTAKNLGIWMDHSNAHLMEFTTDPIETKTIESKFMSMAKSEHIIHNKEQHQQSEYYKNLGEVIKNYEGVILFGPTEAKAELFNKLKEDHHFDKINIEMQTTDKMTENQQHTFVKEHFSKKTITHF